MVGEKKHGIWYMFGLKEEDVAECGGSLYFPSGGLCFVRVLIGMANLVTFIWFLITRKPPVEVVFLWKVGVPRWSSVEAWTLLTVSISSFLLAFVSSQYSRSTARTDLWARIAGPVAFCASTISVYSLFATPFSLPPNPARYVVHILPLLLPVLELVLAARLRFRIRAIACPIGLIQTHQCVAFLYISLNQKNKVAQVSTLQFVGLGLGAFFLTIACAVFVWLLSCITKYFEDESDEKTNFHTPVSYPVSPGKVAQV